MSKEARWLKYSLISFGLAIVAAIVMAVAGVDNTEPFTAVAWIWVVGSVVMIFASILLMVIISAWRIAFSLCNPSQSYYRKPSRGPGTVVWDIPKEDEEEV